ncbi:MAG: leucine-rich repeat domain-containing protein [Clostridia bacterium]|nr:leucine-rich repeat domain-containing protein [Clostridia bacterium]
MKKRIGLLILLGVLALFLTSCACGHKETSITGFLDAACTIDGYTGDKVCNDCGEVVEKGSAIPAMGHITGEITDCVNATCVADGYTGDRYCEICWERVEVGEAIPAQGHTPGEPKGGYAPSCHWEGYTGDICCSTCGVYLKQGEMIPVTPHVEGELVNAAEPTCSHSGFTGEIRCVNCDSILVYGETIPALEHEWTELVNVVEATCLSEGWSGERDCTVCGYHQYNEKTPVLEEHSFDENGVCTSCGWMKPGLYVEDELVMSWEDMVSAGYAVVEKQQLIEIKGNMQMGKLVIGEEVTYIDGNYKPGFKNDTLKEVWIPRSVSKLGTYLLYLNKSITDVRMFCQLESIGGTFIRAEGLERVILPASLVTIYSETFKNTPALKEIVLPDGLQYIGTEAFQGSGITSINIPDSVTNIDLRAFDGCALTEVKLPAALNALGNQVFGYCKNLTKVDMSDCTEMTNMGYGNFRGCGVLTELLLPPNLVIFADRYDQLDGAVSLKHLAFPDGFNNIGAEFFRGTAVESVVWPVSLIDAGGLKNCNMKSIYYRGTEAQWKMTTGSTLFPDAEVIFNYTGE